MFYTSRSAIEKYQQCPRARYWEYLYAGTGMQGAGAAWDLWIGSAVHEAMGYFNNVLMDPPPNFDLTKMREYAAGIGVAWLNTKVAPLELDPEDPIYAECRALVEALVLAYGIKVLPVFMERYKVLGVEREINYPLAGGGLILQSKADAICLDTQKEEISVISYKTAKEYDERTEKGASHDNQGISEAIATEWQLHLDNEELKMLIGGLCSLGSSKLPAVQNIVADAIDIAVSKQYPSERVFSVHMIYLLKGRKEKHPDGYWIHSSPLIRGWRKWNAELSEFEYAWSYDFPNENNKSGKGRLGKGWERFEVWNDYPGGIPAWIEALEANRYQPECGCALVSCFKEVEFFRNEKEAASWLRQTTAQEKEIANAMFNTPDYGMTSAKGITEEEWLDINFPQYRRSCHYPLDCQFTKVCFDSEVAENPLAAADEYGNPLYQIRIPHHEAEYNQLKSLLEAPASSSIETTRESSTWGEGEALESSNIRELPKDEEGILEDQ